MKCLDCGAYVPTDKLKPCKAVYGKQYPQGVPICDKCCAVCNAIPAMDGKKECEYLKEENKTKQKKCEICGELFEPRISRQIYCSKKCNQKAAWERSRALYYKRRNDKRRAEREEKTKRSENTDEQLDILLAEIKEYNDKHGTDLSYGQYTLKFNK